MTSTLKQFRARALARPKVKKAYDGLAEEFILLGEVLNARTESGLSASDIPARAKTTRSTSKHNPTRSS